VTKVTESYTVRYTGTVTFTHTFERSGDFYPRFVEAMGIKLMLTVTP
jgi:hypothetical protein